ncbi:MAG: sugar ABC transporter permease [Chloroflexi bacterium]|nr:sugar ABC transporter permease [Chloroflexota bacterium]
MASVTASAATGKRRQANVRRHVTGYLFVLPALVVYSAFVVYPTLYTFVLSFFSWTGMTPQWGPFVGFGNFTTAMADPVFWTAIRNNIQFVLVRTPLEVGFALVLAVMLNNQMRGWRAWRTLLFVPVVLSLVAVGLVFGRLLEASTGVLNVFLTAVGLKSLALQWLGDPDVALWSIIGVSVWKNIGFSMVIILAGLQSLSQEVVEASRVDGANEVQSTVYVIIPMLRPVIAIATVLSVISGLKVFDLIFIMTQGGPLYSTEVPMTLLYRYAFTFNAMGQAAAVAVMQAALIMFVSWLQLRFVRGEVG